jgi:multiple sugar transport system ATP-binding protein
VATVKLTGVSKIFPKSTVPALRPLDLEVHDKEFVVLVGPSGCGKSTLLRIIAGLEDPTTGTVWIDGRNVTDIPPKDRDIAMVFQNYALYPHMNVYDNMAFGLKLRKYPKPEIRQRVEEAAQVLGISEYLDRKPKALSGGQRQRVALGRAIVRHPKVFLFDEPLSNLDATMRVAMRGELARLHRRLEATMIYVTHDQTEAMTMGDRIVVMRAGEIQQVADPLTLYNHPKTRFVASFIGSPAMNFVPGRVAGDGTPVFENGALRVPLVGILADATRGVRGGEVVLGIRPEDVINARVGDANSPDMPRVAGRVELIEPLGNETFVHAGVADGVTVVSRAGWDVPPAVGDKVEMALRLARAHLFDPASGEALA